MFNCSECSASFATKAKFYRHINQEHKKKKYECKYCNKLFQRSDHLNNHMKTHEMAFVLKAEAHNGYLKTFFANTNYVDVEKLFEEQNGVLLNLLRENLVRHK